MKSTYYAIVTFGSPARRYRKVHRSLQSARDAAAPLKGTGTCSDVRILAFDTRAQAADADISDHRGLGVRGECVATY